MGNAPLFGCLLCCLLMSIGGAQELPLTTCKEYIVEGETLTCLCLGGCANGATPTRTWPGHSDTNRLEKTNITRDNHGQNFTCQKVCGTQTTEIIYTLRVAYGPDAASTNITGPSPFITNRTLSMTLTCETSTNPTPYYSWSGVICDNGNSDSTCIYTPPIQDDGKRVTCEVTNPENSQVGSVSVEFNVSLWYPPNSTAVISGYTPDQIVRNGDILSCTLTGGKPLGNVTFFCTNPDHEGQHNVRDEHSARSSVVIDTSNVTKDMENMTCHCSGHWNPQLDLYTEIPQNATFYTEYRSRLSSFTMNGSDNGTLTVNESDNMTVKIQISAYGRPAPRVSVTKNGTEEMPTNDLWDMYKFSQVVTYTLSSAKCEDTGNYTGIIKNSYINSSAVELVVKCAPRLTRHVLSAVDKCPSAITERGFDLVVVANPLPSTDNVAVKYLGGTLDRNISSLFKVKQRPISLCETRLEVRVTDFTGLPDGGYNLSVSNTLGSFQCSFDRRRKEHLLPARIGYIGGGVLALVVVCVLIRCCIFHYRRREGKGKQGKPGVKHNEGSVNLPIMEYGNGADHDSESGIVASGGSNSPTEIAHMKSDSKQAPRQSDGAGYPAIGDCSLPAQHSGEFRKKSGRAAAYEVTSITSTGKVNIKPAVPQPNAYQDPWDIKKGDMTLADAPGGPPTLHNLGPKGDEYAMVSNPKNKTTITAGPQGANHGKGDNTQGSPAKAQGQEDAAASQGPPLSMTPHPLDTPGYATLAQMAPAQGNQGDVTSSSGDAAASGSPVKNTSSSGDGTDNYDDIQRDGHDPKSMSQGPDEQYSHVGNY